MQKYRNIWQNWTWFHFAVPIWLTRYHEKIHRIKKYIIDYLTNYCEIQKDRNTWQISPGCILHYSRKRIQLFILKQIIWRPVWNVEFDTRYKYLAQGVDLSDKIIEAHCDICPAMRENLLGTFILTFSTNHIYLNCTINVLNVLYYWVHSY